MEKHSKYYYDFDRNMAHRIEKETDLMYFTTQEFDSPDLLNSGEKMDKGFLKLLDNARHSAGIPFKINSGYRTAQHNIDLEKRGYKVAKFSAHLKGLAADISTPNSETRFKVLEALLLQNITRIGIGKNFIHCDIDKTKPQNCMWHYY